MDDALRRAGWICIVVVASAYLTFVSADHMFNSNNATTTPIIMRDILKKGEHDLHGKITVSSTCDEVSVTTEHIADNKYQLAFTTWVEPEVKCLQEPSERVFDTIIFAPSIGVQFIATLDTVPVPLAIYPSISNQ
jgi:hypothetical protein